MPREFPNLLKLLTVLSPKILLDLPELPVLGVQLQQQVLVLLLQLAHNLKVIPTRHSEPNSTPGTQGAAFSPVPAKPRERPLALSSSALRPGLCAQVFCL